MGKKGKGGGKRGGGGRRGGRGRHHHRNHHVPAPMYPNYNYNYSSYRWPWWWTYPPRYYNDWNPWNWGRNGYYYQPSWLYRQEVPVQVKEVIVKQQHKNNMNAILPIIIVLVILIAIIGILT